MTTHADEPQVAPVPNMVDPSYIEDPYPMLARLREAGRVVREPLFGGYMLTRHGDVDAVTRSATMGRDPRKAAEGANRRFQRDQDDLPQSILFLDPPDHTRLRGLVTKAFTPRAVEAMRPRAQAIADELLDAVAGRATFDLMEAFAAPYPTIVIAEMVGVPIAERDQFKRWSDLVVMAFDPFLPPDVQAQVERARDDLRGYFARVIAERRGVPREDLITRLIAAQEEGDRLTDEEMITTLILLLVAGNVTTTDLIGNGVLAFLDHPEQLRKLQADPSLIVNAVEEMLRYDPPVINTGRFVLEETTIDGCPIAQGQSVLPMLASANRDPDVYPEPDRFDIERANTQHHSFGGGIHYCLGAPLARMEAQVAVGTLARRFPNLRLADGSAPTRRRLPGFRGLLSLPVAVD